MTLAEHIAAVKTGLVAVSNELATWEPSMARTSAEEEVKRIQRLIHHYDDVADLEELMNVPVPQVVGTNVVFDARRAPPVAMLHSMMVNCVFGGRS
jgi:hypothetical protein